MPAVPTVPIDKIKDTSADMLKIFTPTYVKQVGVQTVKFKLKEARKAPKTDWKLKAPGKPTKPLKEGWVTKLGEVRKNWKKRWFVLANASERYVCFYFEKEDAKENRKKAKGQILLDGYEVITCEEEGDIKKYGEFSLRLKPHGRRREWYLRFENAEELKSWKEALQSAARRAPSSVTDDKVLSKAFFKAYQKTRWHFPGWCGPWPGWGGTEAEHLGAMISDKCNKDFMGEVYAKIPSGAAYNMVYGKVQSTLDKTVGTAVGAAWKGCDKTIKDLKPKIDEIADKQLDPVAEKNAEVMGKIEAGASAAMAKGLQEIAEPVMGPLTAKLVGPVVECYTAVVRLWEEKMANPKDGDLVVQSREIDSWSWSYWLMGDAWKPIRNFARSDEVRAMDKLLHGFSAWRFEDQVEDSTTTLLRKANFTFGKEIEKNGGDKAKARDLVTAKLQIDARTAAKQYICKILQIIILQPFKSLVIPLLKEVVEPLKSLIPDAIQDVLDIDDMVESVTKNAVCQAIEKSCEPVFGDKLNQIGAKNAAALPSIEDGGKGGAGEGAAEQKEKSAPAEDKSDEEAAKKEAEAAAAEAKRVEEEAAKVEAQAKAQEEAEAAEAAAKEAEAAEAAAKEAQAKQQAEAEEAKRVEEEAQKAAEAAKAEEARQAEEAAAQKAKEEEEAAAAARAAEEEAKRVEEEAKKAEEEARAAEAAAAEEAAAQARAEEEAAAARKAEEEAEAKRVEEEAKKAEEEAQAAEAAAAEEAAARARQEEEAAAARKAEEEAEAKRVEEEAKRAEEEAKKAEEEAEKAEAEAKAQQAADESKAEEESPEDKAQREAQEAVAATEEVVAAAQGQQSEEQQQPKDTFQETSPSNEVAGGEYKEDYTE